jgi:hypothetical protein
MGQNSGGILKLTDASKLFYNGTPKRHVEDVTKQKFKSVFRQRLGDIYTY